MTTKDERDEKLLKDGQKLRVNMLFMDERKDYTDALTHHPSLSRPGYRFAVDSAAKQRVNDAHAEYDREISERYKHTNPEPPNTPAAPVVDSDFDDDWNQSTMYEMYDADLQNRWKGET